MKVLFLDIDGVLNTHDFDDVAECGRIHPDKMQRLNRVLRVTGAGVVLSSAWRYLVHRNEMNVTGLEWLLRSHGFMKGRLVDVLRQDSEVIAVDSTKSFQMTNERGEQIRAWVAGCQNWTGVADVRYAVIDDLDLGITAAGHPFVWTDGKLGMTDRDADQLIELLGVDDRE